jgi:hypothetical protein
MNQSRSRNDVVEDYGNDLPNVFVDPSLGIFIC